MLSCVVLPTCQRCARVTELVERSTYGLDGVVETGTMLVGLPCEGLRRVFDDLAPSVDRKRYPLGYDGPVPTSRAHDALELELEVRPLHRVDRQAEIAGELPDRREACALRQSTARHHRLQLRADLLVRRGRGRGVDVDVHDQQGRTQMPQRIRAAVCLNDLRH